MGSRFLLSGDSCLVMEFGDEISPELNQMVRRVSVSLAEADVQGITELVPTYRSLYIEYDPLQISLEEMKKRLVEIEGSLSRIDLPPPRIVEIPTLYGGEHGPDLASVAEYHSISKREVVEIHKSGDYLVYMLGFTPGFAYLGGLSERISTPRLETPRLRVPAGTVAIAGRQTGVYPVESPGGWRLLGRTPIKMFDPHKDPPSVLQPYDHVRFVEIDEEEYEDIWSRVESGGYEIRTGEPREAA
jgi:inhibitor of KinA